MKSDFASLLESEMLRLMLRQRFTYLFLDCDLRVRFVAENVADILNQPIPVNIQVTEVFDALIGAEPVLRDLYDGKLPEYRLEYVHCATLSDEHYLTLHLHPLRQVDPPGFLLVLEDVTPFARLEQKAVQARNELSLLHLQLDRANEELHHQAFYDALTGLPNRRYFDDELRRAVQHAHANRVGLALLVLDIDNFKDINDTYGHNVGDESLKLLAEALRRSIRITDFAARYGGDEFCVLLTNADVTQARALATRIQARLVEQALSAAVSFTISVGITNLTGPLISPDDFLRRADAGLYQAKRQGKNQIAVSA